jgi:hypothetical protein
MPTITQLSSSNEKKIERILEANLIKYDQAESEQERFRRKLIIDEIYSFERLQASKACSKLNKSIGFAYFIENYKNHERGLHYFSYKLSDEILCFNEDIEKNVHDKYTSYESFEEDKPKTFFINIISKYDEDLANYIKVNLSEATFIDRYIEVIKSNWINYETIKDLTYQKLFMKLEEYYDKVGNRSNYTKSELLIHLSKKNNLIDEFKKYYIMEDTSLDELNELIDSNNIDESLLLEYDLELIKEMDEIVEKNKERKVIKRLK